MHNYRGFIAGILMQAAKDYQKPEHRQAAKEFINSADFAWFWSQVSEDILHWPTTEAAREMILADKLVIDRHAYR
jgi:hypothetical protein